MSRSSLWSLVVVSTCLGLGVIMLAGVESPIRVALALWFLLVCPGLAFVRLLGVRPLLTELSLAVALSVAVDMITGMLLLYAGFWSPGAALAVLIAISVVGSLIQRERPDGPEIQEVYQT